MARKRDEENQRGAAVSGGERKPVSAVRLSPLRLADLPRILDIERSCFAHPWSEESLRDAISSSRIASIGACIPPGLLVGYLVYSEVADELHILNVAIDKAHRRHHIASVMLAHVHKTALAGGRTYSYLEVRESNTAAQKLYEKFGYRRLTARREYYSEEREDAILMGTDLRKSPR